MKKRDFIAIEEINDSIQITLYLTKDATKNNILIDDYVY